MRRFAFVLALAAASAHAQAPDTLRSPIEGLLNYGWSVDATDEWLLVGADERVQGDGGALRGDPKGTVFVYRLGDGAPQLAGRLLSDGIGNQDCFSWSLDVRGDLAVIGAYCEPEDGRSGAVYVYRYDGSVWSREAKIRAADVSAEAQPVYSFGIGVAIGDDYLAIGSVGRAFIYERQNDVWTQTSTLVNSDAASQDYDAFGQAVASFGSMHLLVSAPQSIQPGETLRQGAVYVFERTGTTWMEQARLLCPAVSGRRARLCGYTFGSDGGTRAAVTSESAVHPVQREGSAWTIGGALTPDNFIPVGVAQWGETLAGFGLLNSGSADASWPVFLLGSSPTLLFSADEGRSTDFAVAVNSTTAFVGRASDPANYVLMQRLDASTAEAPPAPAAAALGLMLAPNPAAGTVRVRFETAAAGPARLVVVDALGRRVEERSLGEVGAGAHEVPLGLGRLAAGVYVVRVEAAGVAEARRLVVR